MWLTFSIIIELKNEELVLLMCLTDKGLQVVGKGDSLPLCFNKLGNTCAYSL